LNVTEFVNRIRSEHVLQDGMLGTIMINEGKI